MKEKRVTTTARDAIQSVLFALLEGTFEKAAPKDKSLILDVTASRQLRGPETIHVLAGDGWSHVVAGVEHNNKLLFVPARLPMFNDPEHEETQNQLHLLVFDVVEGAREEIEAKGYTIVEMDMSWMNVGWIDADHMTNALNEWREKDEERRRKEYEEARAWSAEVEDAPLFADFDPKAGF